MIRSKNYTTRSSAIRAAKAACAKAFGDCFKAAEGVDFFIGVDFERDENFFARDRFYYEVAA
jgi:hypothetical protein